MADGDYQVVLTGELAAGHSRESVEAALMELFRLEAAEVRKLLDSAPVVVRSGLDRETAERYRAAIEQSGACCEATRPETSAGSPPAAAAAQPSALVRDEPAERAADDAWSEEPAAGAPGATATASARVVAAGQGIAWWGYGWRAFMRAPWTWVGAGVLYVVLLVLSAVVPFIGGLAATLLSPMLLGGLMFAAHLQHGGEQARVAHLFEGFSRQAAPLLAVGGIYLAGTVLVFLAIMAVMVLLGIGGAAMQGGGMGPAVGVAMSGTSLVALLLAMALSLPLLAAIWFAPALVILHGIKPLDAMQKSLMACLWNWAPMLVYGLLMMVFAVLAALPAGLGWLLLGPVLVLSVYGSYRDIFLR